MVHVFGGVFLDLYFYGSGVHLNELLVLPGGSGLNVSRAFKSLGRDVSLHGFVGGDFAGKYILEEIGDIWGGVKIEDGKTGVFVSKNEREVLAVFKGVNSSGVEPLLENLENVEAVFVTGELGDVESLLRGFSKEIPVFYDPGVLGRFVDVPDGVFVICNEDESAFLNCDVVKMGSKGARMKGEIVRPDFVGEYSVGCGDVFDAVFVDCVLSGAEDLTCLERAVLASSSVSRIRGAYRKALELKGIIGDESRFGSHGVPKR